MTSSCERATVVWLKSQTNLESFRQTGNILIKFFFFFFSTQLYFTIFTFLFVTTRQSSTYQQSITDFKVRTLVCIRTLVTSDNTYTPNNAPKATGNGLIQYGTIITRSILLNFSQEITHSLPVRARNGCLLWVSSLIYALLLSVQCCVYIRDKLDRVITAPDLTTQTSTVYMTDNTRWHHTQ